MSGRELRLILLISLLIAGAGVLWYQRDLFGGTASPVSDTQFLDEYARVRAAEAIDAPLPRCRAYPNPPELHWDANVVDALCKVAARRYISWHEAKQALDGHRYAWLTETLDGYAKRNAEPDNHGYVIGAYRSIFSDPSPAASAALDAWLVAEPDNAIALTARGYQRYAAAWAARGTESARATSDERLRRKDELAAGARADLERARHLQPGLIAVHYGLLTIGQLLGDAELLRRSARDALAIDPADQVVYEKMMDVTQPKWGGSIQAMEALAEQARAHADDNPLLLLLGTRTACVVAEQTARCDRNCTPGDYRAQLAAYRKAADTMPARCFLRYAPAAAYWMGTDQQSVVRYYVQNYRFLREGEAVRYRAETLAALGHADWAGEALERLMRDDAQNPMAYVYAGWVANRWRRFAEAEKLFLKALELEPLQREAITELVIDYSWYLHQPGKAQQLIDRVKATDPSNPRIWLLQAELHHEDAALERSNFEKYLQRVDREGADEYEQSDIRNIEKKLAAPRPADAAHGIAKP